MCGIAGFLCDENNLFKKNLINLSNIKDLLYHRGPDDHGIWHSNMKWLVLLKIISDLSSAGHQPMQLAKDL